MSRSKSNKDSMKNERGNMLDISADDFETPVNFKKFKNSTKVQMSKNECKVKKSSKKKQITLHQMVEQNLKYSDVDPEQLQMALALSKSISDCQTDEVNDIISWDRDDNKNEKRQTLLEFGFKYNKNKMRSEHKIIKKGKDTLKTNKKSKFRFITPILHLRTDEDRESLIQSKISLILTQNVETNSCGHQELGSSHIMSEELLKINCSDCSIFRLNYRLNEFSRTTFSVPELITAENRSKCGCLLRDWKSIPLRERSPDITKTCNKESNKLEKEIQFHQDENIKDCKSEITEPTIKKLTPQKTGNCASIIHEKVDGIDSSINKEIITNTEHKNMYTISSPDLFEDQNSLILTNTSITESTSSKLRRSWKKLFLEDGTPETLILPDDTSSENNMPKGNICYPYNMNSQIAETIIISSSSDEEDIMKNVLNSSVEKQLDNTEDTSLSCNINNLGTECAVPADNVSKECCVNYSELNIVGNTSTLDKNVSIPSSDKYEKLFETNINMGNTNNEANKLHISAHSVGVCGKQDNVNVFQSILESYKECTSLNVTEHIEEIFAQTYSPFTSINISDDEATTHHNEQSEACGRISKSKSSADLHNSSKEKTQTFRENSDYQSFSKHSCSPTFNICLSDEDNYTSNMKTNEKNNIVGDMEIMDDKQTVSHSYGTPLKRYASFNESRTGKTTPSFGRYKSESDITPKNEFIVKTQNITPMINYNQLDTPSIVKELSKFGLKPLKRKRGVNLLQHIYEATHPIVESNRENSHADKKNLKKWKNNKGENVPQNSESISDNQFQKCHLIEPWVETTSESDFIFERQRSSKIPGCQIPLEIVWHNFLVQNPEIRENILLYEPLQVNVISSMLKEEGFKFHIQDLITFLDRKCITIKI